MAVYNEILHIILEIAEAHEDLGLTVNESVKGAAAIGGSAGAGALTGALLGGPVGMIVGGGIGYLCGAGVASATTSSFKPLHVVLSEMSDRDKKKLVKAARRVIERRGINIARQIVDNYASQFCKTLMEQILAEYKAS